MIKAINLKDNDIVYDFGSGYGNLLFLIEKQTGVKGIGYENNLLPFLFSKIKKVMKKSKVTFLFKSFYKFKASDKDVKVFVYLMPNELNRLFSFLKKNNFKGTVISNTFSASNFKEEKILSILKSSNKIYIYKF